MYKRSKHIKSAVGISVLITIIVFFIGDIPKTSVPSYILFVGVASFISVYLISIIIAKAHQRFQQTH